MNSREVKYDDVNGTCVEKRTVSCVLYVCIIS